MVVKRKIDQYDLQDNFIQSFSSVIEASKQLNIERRGISACLKKRYHKSGGFKWRYHDESLVDEVFKDHPIFPLKASNFGRIQFKDGSVTYGYLQKNGYRTIGVVYQGKKYSRLVHRMVMESFHGISSMQVDHINQISDDNRLQNLQYLSAKDHVIKTHSNKK